MKKCRDNVIGTMHIINVRIFIYVKLCSHMSTNLFLIGDKWSWPWPDFLPNINLIITYIEQDQWTFKKTLANSHFFVAARDHRVFISFRYNYFILLFRLILYGSDLLNIVTIARIWSLTLRQFWIRSTHINITKYNFWHCFRI